VGSRAKARRSKANGRVTLLCYQPHQPLRALEVRGVVVEMTESGALEHLDALCLRYTGEAPFFGKCVPAAFHATEKPVIGRILPTHVVTVVARHEPRNS
jgi:hypothetical protein